MRSDNGKSLSILAPAKVNYRLEVLGRRPNGYHDLRMVMQQIALYDRVTVALTEDAAICVRCDHAAVPDGVDNIAYRAAEAMRLRAGRMEGIQITIEKNIPVAAGLGGGSSDCAAVIMALNKLYDLCMTRENMTELGVRFGADVPFFLFGTTALAEGIGEVLSPLTVSCPVWMVLVNPMVAVSTAWVYQNFKLTQNVMLVTIPDSFESLDAVCRLLVNDLEKVTIPAFPVVESIKQLLVEAGAVASLMSGSGPTVFGLFADRAMAEQAAASIDDSGNGWFVTVAAAL